MLTVGIDEIHDNLAAILIDLCGVCRLLAEPAPDRSVEFKLGIYLFEHRGESRSGGRVVKIDQRGFAAVAKVPTILLRISIATLEPEPERPEGVVGAEPARPVSNNVLTPPAPKENDLLLGWPSWLSPSDCSSLMQDQKLGEGAMLEPARPSDYCGRVMQWTPMLTNFDTPWLGDASADCKVRHCPERL